MHDLYAGTVLMRSAELPVATGDGHEAPLLSRAPDSARAVFLHE